MLGHLLSPKGQSPKQRVAPLARSTGHVTLKGRLVLPGRACLGVSSLHAFASRSHEEIYGMVCKCCKQEGVNSRTCGKGEHVCKVGKCTFAGVKQLTGTEKKAVACGCCGRAGKNVTTCAKEGHPCGKKAQGLPCQREEKSGAKLLQMIQLEREVTEEKENRQYLLALPLATPHGEPDNELCVLDLNQQLGSVRITAQRCLDIPGLIPDGSSIPGAAELPDGTRVLVHARELLRTNHVEGSFYVGVTDDPYRRLQQHTRQKKKFIRMIVLARVAAPTVAKEVERYLIASLRPDLNRSNGGESVSPHAPYNYIYIGYGQGGYNLRP